MPKAAVTGASGYIGGALCLGLLKRGYVVVGIVRDPKSPTINHLLHLQKLHPQHLSLAHVPSITEPSPALSAALTGCNVLFHCASPIGAPSENLSKEEYLASAVQSARVSLKAAHDVGCARAVMTSSMAAVVAGQVKENPSLLYNEELWPTDGKYSGKYQESKTLAEREAWKVATELPGLELATVNPGLVLGPPLVAQTPRSSNLILLEMANGVLAERGLRQACIPGTIIDRPPSSVAHIDDVVDVHVAAGEEKAAVGQRYCVAYRDQYTILEIAQRVKQLFPALSVPTDYANDVPEDALRVGRKPNCDSSKAEKLLGRPLKGLDTILTDGVSSMIEQGLIRH